MELITVTTYEGGEPLDRRARLDEIVTFTPARTLRITEKGRAYLAREREVAS